jgi:hypothetical protein
MPVFSDELIERIKAMYPDDSEGLHKALLDPDPGKAMVLLARYAEMGQGIDVSRVIYLLESEKGDDLLAEAREYRERLRLLGDANAQVRRVPHSWRLQGGP